MTIEEIINAIFHRNQRVPQELRDPLFYALKINPDGQPAREENTIVFYAFPGKVQRQLWFKRKEENDPFKLTFRYFPGNGQVSKRLDRYDFPSNDATVFRDLWDKISAFREDYKTWANGNNFN